MKKTILTFGLISGALSATLMIANLLFSDRIGLSHSLFLGYTILVLSFLMVYFGIRSYRDNVGGGHITFGKALIIGMAITLISCVCYVLAWEVLYFNFMPDFMDKYGAQILQKMQASGASAAAIQAKAKELADFKVKYQNLLFNSAMTFIEPFPVGLIITLASAVILRRRPKQPPLPSPATASS